MDHHSNTHVPSLIALVAMFLVFIYLMRPAIGTSDMARIMAGTAQPPFTESAHEKPDTAPWTDTG
jgi:hypothetical protein